MSAGSFPRCLPRCENGGPRHLFLCASAHQNTQPPVAVIHCTPICICRVPHRVEADCRQLGRSMHKEASGRVRCRARHGLVGGWFQGTGYSPYLRGPSTDIWGCRKWETRRIVGCDWRLQERHRYRSKTTPRTKHTPGSAPKADLNCFEGSNEFPFRWCQSPGRHGHITRGRVAFFLSRFELDHWVFRGAWKKALATVDWFQQKKTCSSLSVSCT